MRTHLIVGFVVVEEVVAVVVDERSRIVAVFLVFDVVVCVLVVRTVVVVDLVAVTSRRPRYCVFVVLVILMEQLVDQVLM